MIGQAWTDLSTDLINCFNLWRSVKVEAIQKLNLDIEIDIPSDSILIKKVEFQKLKDQELTGVYWTMKDLEKRINKKQHWIKENILYNPNFKELLDSRNGGFVYYPHSQGQPWSFQARKMAEFLDHYFHKIHNQ